MALALVSLVFVTSSELVIRHDLRLNTILDQHCVFWHKLCRYFVSLHRGPDWYPVSILWCFPERGPDNSFDYRMHSEHLGISGVR
jgi:hypothetical protein